jgi:tRNA U34 5-methylaminomethyl-2-thiouridine-forming methyltransferase MnmC
MKERTVLRLVIFNFLLAFLISGTGVFLRCATGGADGNGPVALERIANPTNATRALVILQDIRRSARDSLAQLYVSRQKKLESWNRLEIPPHGEQLAALERDRAAFEQALARVERFAELEQDFASKWNSANTAVKRWKLLGGRADFDTLYKLLIESILSMQEMIPEASDGANE